jgi:anaerobic selenocysteine-containing dehydrogenase
LGLTVSAQATNEGMTAFVELSEKLLRADTYAILGRPDWAADDILREADQNPNRAGAELVFEAYSLFDEGPSGLRNALTSGQVKTLLMLGTDHPSSSPEWLEAVEKAQVVAFTSNWDETALRANLVLPLTTFAEQDGTWVNVQNRLQRVQRAIKPINGRKSEVEAAAWAAQALGASPDAWAITNWLSAFKALQKRVPALEGVKALKLLPWGHPLTAASSAPRANAPATAPA